MRHFFEARSVAVIGVSGRSDNLGRSIVQNLERFQFQGEISLVGARGGELLGRPIHGSVSEVPREVDLAVVLTPARSVPSILDACGERGIRRVVVESAGFGEYGGEGEDLDRACVEAARRHDIRFIGPNCLGILNVPTGLCVPFARLENIFRPGGVSIISQSGGVGIGYLSLLAAEGIGVARFASVGNKLDVDENDLLEYLLVDDGTTHVVMYLEGLRDGRRLMALAREASKPILVHKANTGRLSRAIAASHTASLAGDDAVLDAALAQCGVTRFADGRGLLTGLRGLSQPRLRGRSIAVISRSGGHAVIVADACEKRGLGLADFPADLLSPLVARFRAGVVRFTNPLDLGDLFDFELYVRIVEEALGLAHVDGAVFLHTYIPSLEGEASREVFRRLTELPARLGKPLALCAVTEPDELRELTRAHPLAIHADPEDAVRALALGLSREPEASVGEPMEPLPASERIARVLAGCRVSSRDPTGAETLAMLALAGLRVAPGRPISDLDDGLRAAREMDFPLVLKLDAEGVLHKSDLGGVVLGIQDERGLRDAFLSLSETLSHLPDSVRHPGLLLQRQEPDGLELILGARRDPCFGPVVLVGMGGIFAEILEDIAIRVAPVGVAEARRMLAGLRGAPLLGGTRGRSAQGIDGVVLAVRALSRLMIAFPEIEDIDVNPMRTRPDPEPPVALDARMRLRRDPHQNSS